MVNLFHRPHHRPDHGCNSDTDTKSHRPRPRAGGTACTTNDGVDPDTHDRHGQRQQPTNSNTLTPVHDVKRIHALAPFERTPAALRSLLNHLQLVQQGLCGLGQSVVISYLDGHGLVPWISQPALLNVGENTQPHMYFAGTLTGGGIGTQPQASLWKSCGTGSVLTTMTVAPKSQRAL